MPWEIRTFAFGTLLEDRVPSMLGVDSFFIFPPHHHHQVDYCSPLAFHLNLPTAYKDGHRICPNASVPVEMVWTPGVHDLSGRHCISRNFEW